MNRASGGAPRLNPQRNIKHRDKSMSNRNLSASPGAAPTATAQDEERWPPRAPGLSEVAGASLASQRPCVLCGSVPTPMCTRPTAQLRSDISQAEAHTGPSFQHPACSSGSALSRRVSSQRLAQGLVDPGLLFPPCGCRPASRAGQRIPAHRAAGWAAGPAGRDVLTSLENRKPSSQVWPLL